MDESNPTDRLIRPARVTMADIGAEVAALLDDVEKTRARIDAELDRIDAAVTRLEERQGVTA